MIILEHDLSYLHYFFPMQITPKSADILGAARPPVDKSAANIPTVEIDASKTPSSEASEVFLKPTSILFLHIT